MTAPDDLQRAIVGAVPELTGEQVADIAAGPPVFEEYETLADF